MSTKKQLSPGACFDKANFIKCALRPEECTSTKFYSPLQLQATNNQEVANGCSSQETIRRLRSLGRCDGQADRYICTSDKTACRFSAVFEPFADDCDLVQDFMESNEFSTSHYGFCRAQQPDREDFCAWRFKECGGDIWEWQIADPFFANQNPDCHCDDVKTGACIKSETNDTFCAVTKEVCEGDEGYEYVSVLDLESDFNTTCKLCDTLPPLSTLLVAPSVSPTSYPTLLSTVMVRPPLISTNDPTLPPTTIVVSSPASSTIRSIQSGYLGVGAVVGIVVGSLVGVV